MLMTMTTKGWSLLEFRVSMIQLLPCRIVSLRKEFGGRHTRSWLVGRGVLMLERGSPLLPVTMQCLKL